MSSNENIRLNESSTHNSLTAIESSSTSTKKKQKFPLKQRKIKDLKVKVTNADDLPKTQNFLGLIRKWIALATQKPRTVQCTDDVCIQEKCKPKHKNVVCLGGPHKTCFGENEEEEPKVEEPEEEQPSQSRNLDAVASSYLLIDQEEIALLEDKLVILKKMDEKYQEMQNAAAEYQNLAFLEHQNRLLTSSEKQAILRTNEVKNQLVLKTKNEIKVTEEQQPHSAPKSLKKLPKQKDKNNQIKICLQISNNINFDGTKANINTETRDTLKNDDLKKIIQVTGENGMKTSENILDIRDTTSSATKTVEILDVINKELTEDTILALDGPCDKEQVIPTRSPYELFHEPEKSVRHGQSKNKIKFYDGKIKGNENIEDHIHVPEKSNKISDIDEVKNYKETPVNIMLSTFAHNNSLQTNRNLEERLTKEKYYKEPLTEVNISEVENNSLLVNTSLNSNKSEEIFNKQYDYINKVKNNTFFIEEVECLQANDQNDTRQDYQDLKKCLCLSSEHSDQGSIKSDFMNKFKNNSLPIDNSFDNNKKAEVFGKQGCCIEMAENICFQENNGRVQANEPNEVKHNHTDLNECQCLGTEHSDEELFIKMVNLMSKVKSNSSLSKKSLNNCENPELCIEQDDFIVKDENKCIACKECIQVNGHNEEEQNYQDLKECESLNTKPSCEKTVNQKENLMNPFENTSSLMKNTFNNKKKADIVIKPTCSCCIDSENNGFPVEENCSIQANQQNEVKQNQQDLKECQCWNKEHFYEELNIKKHNSMNKVDTNLLLSKSRNHTNQVDQNFEKRQFLNIAEYYNGLLMRKQAENHNCAANYSPNKIDNCFESKNENNNKRIDTCTKNHSLKERYNCFEHKKENSNNKSHQTQKCHKTISIEEYYQRILKQNNLCHNQVQSNSVLKPKSDSCADDSKEKDDETNSRCLKGCKSLTIAEYYNKIFIRKDYCCIDNAKSNDRNDQHTSGEFQTLTGVHSHKNILTDKIDCSCSGIFPERQRYSNTPKDTACSRYEDHIEENDKSIDYKVFKQCYPEKASNNTRVYKENWEECYSLNTEIGGDKLFVIKDDCSCSEVRKESDVIQMDKNFSNEDNQERLLEANDQCSCKQNNIMDDFSIEGVCKEGLFINQGNLCSCMEICKDSTNTECSYDIKTNSEYKSQQTTILTDDVNDLSAKSSSKYLQTYFMLDIGEEKVEIMEEKLECLKNICESISFSSEKDRLKRQELIQLIEESGLCKTDIKNLKASSSVQFLETDKVNDSNKMLITEEPFDQKYKTGQHNFRSLLWNVTSKDSDKLRKENEMKQTNLKKSLTLESIQQLANSMHFQSMDSFVSLEEQKEDLAFSASASMKEKLTTRESNDIRCYPTTSNISDDDDNTKRNISVPNEKPNTKQQDEAQTISDDLSVLTLIEMYLRYPKSLILGDSVKALKTEPPTCELKNSKKPQKCSKADLTKGQPLSFEKDSEKLHLGATDDEEIKSEYLSAASFSSIKKDESQQKKNNLD